MKRLVDDQGGVQISGSWCGKCSMGRALYISTNDESKMPRTRHRKSLFDCALQSTL